MGVPQDRGHGHRGSCDKDDITKGDGQRSHGDRGHGAHERSYECDRADHRSGKDRDGNDDRQKDQGKRGSGDENDRCESQRQGPSGPDAHHAPMVRTRSGCSVGTKVPFLAGPVRSSLAHRAELDGGSEISGLMPPDACKAASSEKGGGSGAWLRAQGS